MQMRDIVDINRIRRILSNLGIGALGISTVSFICILLKTTLWKPCRATYFFEILFLYQSYLQEERRILNLPRHRKPQTLNFPRALRDLRSLQEEKGRPLRLPFRVYFHLPIKTNLNPNLRSHLPLAIKVNQV